MAVIAQVFDVSNELDTQKTLLDTDAVECFMLSASANVSSGYATALTVRRLPVYEQDVVNDKDDILPACDGLAQQISLKLSGDMAAVVGKPVGGRYLHITPLADLGTQ